MTDEIADDGVLPEDWRARAMAAEQTLGRLQRESQDLRKQVELKVEAIRAGMVDLDGLKLVDLDQVPLAEDGSVADAAGLMTRLKRSKPWLFGAGSSSSTAAVPRAEPPHARQARDLNEAEWRVARAELLRRAGS